MDLNAGCGAWDDVYAWAAAAALRCGDDAARIKRATAGVLTAGDVGYHYHVPTGAVALLARGPYTDQDLALCKHAAAHAVGAARVFPGVLDVEDVGGGDWVKVAYSHGLRRLGEYLNFFPGHYPGGIPNRPGPVAASLSGGLLGAGLGYGLGTLGENLMPATWQRGKLRKTLAVAGALAGAAPGATLAYANHATGHTLNDPAVLEPPPGSGPTLDREALEKVVAGGDGHVPLADAYVKAAVAFASGSATGFGFAPESAPPSALDVNVDALGQTLWDAPGITPETYGTTMAVLRTAQQMPGGRGPGVVTPTQLGRLAAATGVGYAAGAMMGSVLGALTGLPPAAQNTLRNSGALVGLVNAALPALFGG